MIASLIALAVMLSYITLVIVSERAVPSSLSSTYYTGVGRVSLIPVLGIVISALWWEGVSVIPERSLAPLFIGLVALSFVAASPNSRDNGIEGAVHQSAAIVSAVALQVVVLLCAPKMLFAWFAFPALALLCRVVGWKSYLLFSELICFITLIGTYICLRIGL